MSNTVALPIPSELVEELAQHSADAVVERMEDMLRPTAGGWMRTAEAAEDLGWSTRTLHARVAKYTIPYYRVDRRLLFKQSDLEAWLVAQQRQQRLVRQRRAASRRPSPPPRRLRALGLFGNCARGARPPGLRG